MHAATFAYHRAQNLDEAIRLLEMHGEDAKLLAGGHSLVPLMKLRFSRPAHLIDIRQVSELKGIRTMNGELVIGAATTHTDVERSELVRQWVPALAEAAASIGDMQVRNMGTVGGNLAHADPGADLPAVMLALGAELRLVGRETERAVPADSFFVGLMTTALRESEVLKEVRIPLPQPRSGTAYAKHPHPASRFAVTGVAVSVALDEAGRIDRARVGLTGLDHRARRATAVEDALLGVDADVDQAVAEAAELAAEDLLLSDDRHGSVEYKQNLARTYTRRALSRALERARDG